MYPVSPSAWVYLLFLARWSGTAVKEWKDKNKKQCRKNTVMHDGIGEGSKEQAEHNVQSKHLVAKQPKDTERKKFVASDNNSDVPS